MPSRTKIVVTIGPAVGTKEKIMKLIEAGMNVARLNFSHGTYDEHKAMIDLIKEVRESLQLPLPLMLDTKGAEIRLGHLAKEEVFLNEGQEFLLVKNPVEGNEEQITLTPAMAIDALREGMLLLLDNGYIQVRVVKRERDSVKVRVEHGGVIRSTRGVNIPEVDLNFPALTEKDIEDIKFGCEQDVDFIAASFIRSADHVLDIKRLLHEQGKPEIELIAKIENSKGVANFNSIVAVADGIMVARGDLGVEMPLTQVPRLQKMMIRESTVVGKSSVTATQMLESMIKNPRPTRAEASDVANAIYDSTSAVMLSGETAIGRFPIEAVKMMKAIIQDTESDFDYYEFFKKNTQRVFSDVPFAVAQASLKTAYHTGAKAIFAFSSSGSTVKLLSRLRPEMPIIALTSNPKVYHQLALAWGVTPLLCTETSRIEEAYEKIVAFALEKKLVRQGDLVVITAGTPFGRPGTTNMMIVNRIGDILMRGQG